MFGNFRVANLLHGNFVLYPLDKQRLQLQRGR